MFTKLARFEDARVTGIWSAPEQHKTANLDKVSDFSTYRTVDGFIYARIRAISSRVNRNDDGWPSIELAGAQDIFDRHKTSSEGNGFVIEASRDYEHGFSTFLGKPVFVDHNNHDPQRARGVVVDARLHVEDAKTSSLDAYYSSPDVDPSHLPPTWVELLLEVDSKAFPKLAKALVDGSKDPSKGINGFSMGCNVGYTECSVPSCRKQARTATDFCDHIRHMKGATVPYKDPQTGERKQARVYENCFKCSFFELSCVFDPADETALLQELRTASAKESALYPEQNIPGYETGTWGGGEWPERTGMVECPHCGGDGFDNNSLPCRSCRGNGFIKAPNPGRDAPNLSPTWERPTSPEHFMPLPNEIIGMEPIMGNIKTAENPLPQSLHERAPATVDTLRDENACSVCGSLMDGDTCDVCGYSSPPEGFGNPDLNKAKDTRQQMEQQKTQDPTAQPTMMEGPGTPPTPGGSGGTFQSPYSPSPTNSSITAKVNIEPMNWQLSLHPKQAGKINTGERPILPGNPSISNEPQETIIRDYPKPTTAMHTARSMMATVQQRRAMKTADNAPSAASPGGPAPDAATPDARGDVEGVGGYIEDNNDEASKADTQVDVTGIGGTGAEGVAAEESQNVTQGTEKSKNVEEIHTMTWSDGKGDSLGQHDPVSSDSGENLFDKPPGRKSHERTAYESGPGENLISDPEPGQKPGADPADPVGKAQDRVDLTQATTTPENNSGPTKTWSGTNGNGVTEQRNPVTNEVVWSQDPSTNAGTTARTHLLSALRLAETEVELGLITPDQKFARIAELEGESPEAIHASLKFASRVKQAGLQRKVAKIAKVPSFSHPVQMKEGSAISLNDLDDSAIFS